MKNKTAFTPSSLLSLVLLLLAVAVNAQTPRTSPTPHTTATPAPQDAQPATPAAEVTAGNYNIITSIELGVRGLSVDGNDDKYRSDLNYRAGFRLFDSNFLARAKDGTGGWFDSLLVNSTGWNADPHGSLRINAEKSAWYRFNANVRRNTYQNRLVNHALGQHIRDTRHKFGDFDLRLLPRNRFINFSLGYSFDRNSGDGLTTFNYSNLTASRGSAFTVRGGDEFAVNRTTRTRADEYRAGVEGRVGKLDLGFLQGIRTYADDSQDFINFANQGNNTANTAALLTFQRDMPMHGRAYFTRLNAHTNIARRLDITARYTYTHARTRFNLIETDTGRTAGTGANPLANALTYSTIITFPGETVRPSHLGEIGMTWMVTDKLRISETLRHNSFRNEGDHVYNEITSAFRANGTPLFTPAPAAFAVPIARTLEYSRLYNQLEADYQFGPRLAVHFGHRYANRHIDTLNLGRILPAPIVNAPGVVSEEEFRFHSNSFFGGFKARPVKQWTLYFDAARGESNDVFTRLDNRKSVNFRVRNRITPARGLGLNVSFITRDNDNPGETVVDRTLVGPQSSRQFDVQTRDRNFSTSLDWTPPAGRYSLSAGYTHLNAESDAAIAFFPLPAGCVGTTAVPLPPCAEGRSRFYLRDHFFYFNANVQFHERFSAFASYRISKDTGQGDRLSDIPNRLFVGSYPLSFQSPEARLVFKLSRNVDWNVGYQYYAYRERFSNAQNYRAHLPNTSLRIYFGGASGER
ncbi:MAG: hypothetical protein QOG71_2874 [Pyrinomonadaceae bacterium]|nr:hypothetical protein [Pyrinomonadaceae bacterium]